jgi:hypothetical protein
MDQDTRTIQLAIAGRKMGWAEWQRMQEAFRDSGPQLVAVKDKASGPTLRILTYNKRSLVAGGALEFSGTPSQQTPRFQLWDT